MAEENNSFTDIRYKLQLRGLAELETTAFTVAADNPRELTDAEVTAFKAYRKAWNDLMKGSIDGIQVNPTAEMLLSNFEMPTLPDGWVMMTRAVGDLPPILARVSEYDCYDSSYGGRATSEYSNYQAATQD